MSEEQLLILRMLEEHKLTVEEAMALLDAVGKSDAKERAHSGDDVSKLVSRVGKEIGEHASKLGDLLDSWGISSIFAGARQEVTKEFTGELLKGETPLDVTLTTRNGSLTVEPWENDGYKIVARRKVVAANEDEVEQILADAVAVSVSSGRMEVIAKETPQVRSISLHAYLPANLVYNLRLQTANGAIRANELQLEEAYWQTTNGNIRSLEIMSKTLAASTTNGSIAVEKSAVNNLRLGTTNGSIRVAPVAGKSEETKVYQVSTCNGSISVDLGANFTDAGVEFHAKTKWGQIRPIGNWRISHEQNSMGNRHVAGASGSGDVQLTLELSSVNGSINLQRV